MGTLIILGGSGHDNMVWGDDAESRAAVDQKFQELTGYGAPAFEKLTPDGDTVQVKTLRYEALEVVLAIPVQGGMA
jgi:hypothetical protein